MDAHNINHHKDTTDRNVSKPPNPTPATQGMTPSSSRKTRTTKGSCIQPPNTNPTPATQGMTPSSDSNVSNPNGSCIHSTNTNPTPATQGMTPSSDSNVSNPNGSCIHSTNTNLTPVTQGMTPSDSNVSNPERPIDNEGFIIVDRQRKHNQSVMPFVTILKQTTTSTETQPPTTKPLPPIIKLTINRRSHNVCTTWVRFCMASIEDKRLHSCKSKHPSNSAEYPHLSTALCHFFLVNGFCKKGSECKYFHPDEFAHVEAQPCVHVPRVECAAPVTPSSHPTTSPTQTKIRTSVCEKYMLQKYNEKLEGCQHKFCNFSHDLTNVTLFDFIRIFRDKLVKGNLNFQEIYTVVYWTVHDNISHINDCLRKVNKPTVKVPEPIPANFEQVLKIWTDGASAARRCNEDNKLEIFEGVDSQRENDVWALARSFDPCAKDFNIAVLNVLRSIGLPQTVNKNDLCTHCHNCKNGIHVSSGDTQSGQVLQICTYDMCGKCKCLSVEEIIAERERLYGLLIQHKRERDQMKPGSNTQEIDFSIRYLARRYVETYDKFHPSKYGYKQLTTVRDRNEVCVVPTDADFVHNLPKMSDADRAELMADQNAYVDMMTAIAKEQQDAKKAYNGAIELVRRCMRHRRNYNLIVKAWQSDTVINLFYVIFYVFTGACDLMTFNEFVVDFKDKRRRIFFNWYLNYTNIPYLAFSRDVLTKMEVWENMGISRRMISADDQGNIFEEFCVPSEKSDYNDFWGWYTRTPFDRDRSVVGNDETAAKLAIAAPALFQEYLEYRKACAKARPLTFSEWLKQNETYAEIAKIFASSSVSYFAVSHYVKMKVKSTGMSLDEFAKHKRADVVLWMSVNVERIAINLINGTNHPPLSIDQVIADSKMCKQFYDEGWWRNPIYGGDLCEFMSACAEGWEHKVSGVNTLASEQQARLDKQKAKESKQNYKYNKRKSKQTDDTCKTLLTEYLTTLPDNTIPDNTKMARTHLSKTKKEKKPLPQKVVPVQTTKTERLCAVANNPDSRSDFGRVVPVQPTKTDLLYAIANNSDSDSDSYSSSDFGSELEYGTGQTDQDVFGNGEDEFDKNEPPPNVRFPLPYNAEKYFYRERKMVPRESGLAMTSTIYIGPFLTEKAAYNVMELLRKHNRSIGRNVKPRVVSSKGVEGQSTTSWDVMYKDTVNIKYEKPDAYYWFIDFVIKVLCISTGPLPTLALKDFKSNIPGLNDIFLEAQNVKDTPKPVVKAAKKTIAPIVVVAKEPIRRTKDDIASQLEKAKLARIAAKQAKPDKPKPAKPDTAKPDTAKPKLAKPESAKFKLQIGKALDIY